MVEPLGVRQHADARGDCSLRLLPVVRAHTWYGSINFPRTSVHRVHTGHSGHRGVGLHVLSTGARLRVQRLHLLRMLPRRLL